MNPATQFIGKPCKRGHTLRWRNGRQCVECGRASRRVANMTPDQIARKRASDRRSSHKYHHRKQQTDPAYRADKLARARAWNAANPEKLREYVREYGRRKAGWYDEGGMATDQEMEALRGFKL